MASWLVSVPAWGQRYINTFVDAAWPSILAAMQLSGADFRFLIHTDNDAPISKCMGGHRVEFVKIEDNNTPHHILGECHREAIQRAHIGEKVALLNADIILSRECFSAAERRFQEGKKLIISAATRCAVDRDSDAPVGVTSRELLEWTMKNYHHTIEECFWGTGHTCVPWAIYFHTSNGVVLRGFHLHPFAVVKRNGLSFSGPTIDADLADRFQHSETHVVTNPDEMALAELSPPERRFGLGDVMTEDSVAEWANTHASERHRWLFQHRIIIQGDGSGIEDIPICHKILKLIDEKY